MIQWAGSGFVTKRDFTVKLEPKAPEKVVKRERPIGLGFEARTSYRGRVEQPDPAEALKAEPGMGTDMQNDMSMMRERQRRRRKIEGLQAVPMDAAKIQASLTAANS